VNLQARGASTQPTMWATSNGVGDGVTVTDIKRVRNDFLEGRSRAEHAQTAYLTNQQQVYSAVENIFAEPSDTALQAQLADLWAGFDDVGNNPDQSGPRGALLETAATIADGLNNAHTALSGQWASMRTQLNAYATEVNTTAGQIATLNAAIRNATAAGLPVNELADQRDGFVMQLSKVAGASAATRDDGTVDVYLGGSTLVSGGNARSVQVSGAGRLSDVGGDPLKVTFADTGNAATVGGSMGSVTNALTTVLPSYAGGLDDVAAKLSATVNAVHSTGYGLDGVTGRDMFTGSTASTIRVALTDGAHIAASALPGGNFDASNADALARLARSDSGPDTSYRLLVANLGVASQTVTRRSEIQTAITEDADAARLAESGVSLDEEMTNLLSFQRAYEAASRVLTTIDSTLDVIINRMAV
jgi:flagellar hook-associated protein 1 FlgK